ncbi:hypothetical protein L228DRAFT_157696 [Xylona heveae TC161]|uniref:Uncharacterized protein n=1 Tax=Xylona heveae (strain CBS 132557 / TC161) TaxID=1328760 RepID=A0A165G2W2_XYLHT|nr:hypothetical protein L228DRAFT_157696 [Xylona heveae TC161]KZF21677.1 hypothetical protein L228DRAFT_157696 [Xylona heveae TC161]
MSSQVEQNFTDGRNWTFLNQLHNSLTNVVLLTEDTSYDYYDMMGICINQLASDTQLYEYIWYSYAVTTNFLSSYRDFILLYTTFGNYSCMFITWASKLPFFFLFRHSILGFSVNIFQAHPVHLIFLTFPSFIARPIYYFYFLLFFASSDGTTR